MNDFGNRQVRNLPPHLRQYVVDQNYESYTPQNHAVWRYVMRQNYDYLKKVAHESYVDGLAKTGIGIESIPNLKTMNEILGKIGWGAVCVDGFIPPAAFMEFQAYKVLVIAADIRQINHIEYTPAPDIIHEAAGHAPIIANPAYAEYLRLFGEIGSKALSSSKDYELYEAIRYLSIIKEDPTTEPEEVKKAEAEIDRIEANMGTPSEMSKIRNLHWWTVEYGLVGSLNDPKIYGAGLLSSIGESVECMTDRVKKLPYTVEAADQAFDITEMQPQLFVTPDFRHLTKVLEEFANTMGLRTGGLSGLNKAIESGNLATSMYSSGLQVSGVFAKALSGKDGKPAYIQTIGPTALAYFGKELIGHDKSYHAEGFGSPVGKLKGVNQPIELMSDSDLEANGMTLGQNAKIEFESGVKVRGFIANVRKDAYGKVLVVSFTNAHAEFNGEILFQPEWGVYDMAVGASIDSVFNGPADITAFELPRYAPKETTHKIHYSEKEKELHGLYQEVRGIRHSNSRHNRLVEIWEILKSEYGNDWLLSMEILELIHSRPGYEDTANEIQAFLNEKAEAEEHLNKLIQDGMELMQEA